MSNSRRVTSAFAVSVLVHLILFTVLALMPESHSALASKVTDQKAMDKPLELVVQAAPQATPSPTPTLESQGEIPTPLERANLKQADRAPQNAKRLAAYHSKAADPKQGEGSSQTPKTSATPAPTPALSLNPAVLSVQAAQPAESKPVATPATGAPKGTGKDEEFGIDATGSYGLAIDKALNASSWLSSQASEKVSVGEVVLEFAVDARGTASRIRVLSDDTGNPANARFAIRAICDAKFPPIPRDLLADSPGGRKVFKRSFIKNPTP